MRLQRCPKCNAKVGPTDIKCLDCGEDLIAHLEELRKAATQKRVMTKEERLERARKAAELAARGRAFGIERSEETRMRTFDQHQAEVTKNEIITAWATAGIALIIGLVAIKIGATQFKTAGGVEALRSLSMAQLREWGFGMLVQPVVQALVAAGVGVGSLLCTVGQTWRAFLAHKSVAAVARGEKPLVVYIHIATRLGLVILSLAFPLFGVICGLILRLGGRDEDTKSLGAHMLIAGLLVMVVVGANMLYGLAAGLKPADQPPGLEETGTDQKVGMWQPSGRMACPLHSSLRLLA
ncbi:MAG: hypothetical protein ACUVX8_07725 [Candidatus Zipacnadales bacterium]